MKLGNRHIFKVLRIIKKAGIRTLIVNILANRGSKDAESIGIDLFDIIIEAFDNEEVEQLLYELLADISNKTTDEVSLMNIEETKDLFVSIAEANNLKSFFQYVSATLKKN